MRDRLSSRHFSTINRTLQCALKSHVSRGYRRVLNIMHQGWNTKQSRKVSPLSICPDASQEDNVKFSFVSERSSVETSFYHDKPKVTFCALKLHVYRWFRRVRYIVNDFKQGWEHSRDILCVHFLV